MRTNIREKKYYCGEYLDVYIYPTYKTAKSRSKKGKPTSDCQKALNKKNSRDKIVRLLHANFTRKDIEIHLTYENPPDTPEQAKKDTQNYIRRLRRLRQKNGLPELKYICVTEKSGKGRYHHHITLSGGIDRDVLERLWGHGYANSKRLQFTNNGLEGLGKYITKEPIFYKRWHASRNIINPPAKKRDGRISQRTASLIAMETAESKIEIEKLYPGYLLAEAESFHNEINRGTYIFARLYKANGEYKNTKRRKIRNG